MSNTLYDSDLQVWVEQTIKHLQNREFEAIDIEHLVEELAELGRAERNALKSNLMILLAHLLKLRIQHDAPDNMKASWYSSILEHRQRVLNSLTDTPSLKSFINEAAEQAYPKAQKLAIREGKLAQFGVRIPDESEYPLECPFTLEQILDEDFLGWERSDFCVNPGSKIEQLEVSALSNALF
jgi:hypothetical protein